METNISPNIYHDIENRLKNIRDVSLRALVENITALINKYKELQNRLTEQTKNIEKLNNDKVKQDELQDTYNNNIKKLFERIKQISKTSPSKSPTLSNSQTIEENIIQEINNIITEKDKEFKDLQQQIVYKNKQLIKKNDAEYQRNATINEMNKTASNIIKQLDHISGKINAAAAPDNSSSGGTAKQKKRFKSKKMRKHKKTRTKRK